MVHPVLLFAGLFVAKKAVAVSLYMAGKRYGWPRVYRRILEYNRKLTPASQQAAIVTGVKKAFHFPTQALQVIQSQEAFQFINSYAAYMRRVGGLAGTATAKMAESFIHAPSQWFAELMPMLEKDFDAEQSTRVRKHSDFPPGSERPEPLCASGSLRPPGGQQPVGAASSVAHGARDAEIPEAGRPGELR